MTSAKTSSKRGYLSELAFSCDQARLTARDWDTKAVA